MGVMKHMPIVCRSTCFGIGRRLKRQGGPILVALALIAVIAVTGQAEAQLRVDITRGNVQPLPIAIPPFVGGAGSPDELSQNVSQVITADLRRSGLFAPIDPAAFVDPLAPPDGTPNFANWRPLNAQALVAGRLAQTADGASSPNSACGTFSPANNSPASNSSPVRRIGGASPISSPTSSMNG